MVDRHNQKCGAVSDDALAPSLQISYGIASGGQATIGTIEAPRPEVNELGQLTYLQSLQTPACVLASLHALLETLDPGFDAAKCEFCRDADPTIVMANAPELDQRPLLGFELPAASKGQFQLIDGRNPKNQWKVMGRLALALICFVLL